MATAAYPATLSDLSTFDPADVALVDILIGAGQEHLFANWRPGADAEKKRAFFESVRALEANYPGGVTAYAMPNKTLAKGGIEFLKLPLCQAGLGQHARSCRAAARNRVGRPHPRPRIANKQDSSAEGVPDSVKNVCHSRGVPDCVLRNRRISDGHEQRVRWRAATGVDPRLRTN